MESKREALKRRIVPLDIYRLTPKTNCGDCGYPTCLAFATQAVVGEITLDMCPHLDRELMRTSQALIDQQLDQGIGKKRESFEKTLEFLRSQVAPWLTPENATALGAHWTDHNVAMPVLRLKYVDDEVIVSQDDVQSLTGRQLSPWEKIFLYNYVIGGAVEPSGRWVGMESLPNSVSKVKSLKAHCEEPLSKTFPEDPQSLRRATAGLFEELPVAPGHADWVGECRLLPKVRIRLLWWAGDREEGFPARVKFLFDARVLETLDLESLLFACEQLTERILDAGRPADSD